MFTRAYQQLRFNYCTDFYVAMNNIQKLSKNNVNLFIVFQRCSLSVNKQTNANTTKIVLLTHNTQQPYSNKVACRPSHLKSARNQQTCSSKVPRSRERGRRPLSGTCRSGGIPLHPRWFPHSSILPERLQLKLHFIFTMNFNEFPTWTLSKKCEAKTWNLYIKKIIFHKKFNQHHKVLPSVLS